MNHMAKKTMTKTNKAESALNGFLTYNKPMGCSDSES